MAKTIMVSNSIYAELKKRKGDKSFSEIIKESLDGKKIKTGKDLLAFVGILKDDDEYEELMKKTKKMWGEWTKRIKEESA